MARVMLLKICDSKGKEVGEMTVRSVKKFSATQQLGTLVGLDKSGGLCDLAEFLEAGRVAQLGL